MNLRSQEDAIAIGLTIYRVDKQNSIWSTLFLITAVPSKTDEKCCYKVNWQYPCFIIAIVASRLRLRCLAWAWSESTRSLWVKYLRQANASHSSMFDNFSSLIWLAFRFGLSYNQETLLSVFKQQPVGQRLETSTFYLESCWFCWLTRRHGGVVKTRILSSVFHWIHCIQHARNVSSWQALDQKCCARRSAYIRLASDHGNDQADKIN